MRIVVFSLLACVIAAAAPDGPSFELAKSAVDFQYRFGGKEMTRIVEATGPGVALFDADGDGDLDIYFVNGGWIEGISSDAKAKQAKNRLYRNDGDWKFTDVSAAAGVANDGWGKGPTFADVDHDGDLDFYEGDCKLANQFYINDGTGNFTDVAADLPDLKNEGVRTKATAFSDFDGDGDLDLYVVNWNVPNRIYMNNQNDDNYLKVRVEGSLSSRMAVGAVAGIYEAGHAGDAGHFLGRRELQTATGFCSQEAPELHFGLSSSALYDLVVTFPSGTAVTMKDIKPGQTLTVEEPSGIARK